MKKIILLSLMFSQAFAISAFSQLKVENIEVGSKSYEGTNQEDATGMLVVVTDIKWNPIQGKFNQTAKYYRARLGIGSDLNTIDYIEARFVPVTHLSIDEEEGVNTEFNLINFQYLRSMRLGVDHFVQVSALGFTSEKVIDKGRKNPQLYFKAVADLLALNYLKETNQIEKMNLTYFEAGLEVGTQINFNQSQAIRITGFANFENPYGEIGVRLSIINGESGYSTLNVEYGETMFMETSLMKNQYLRKWLKLSLNHKL